MNNEEKILNLLIQMQKQMDDTQYDIKSLKDTQDSMGIDISEIKKNVFAINEQTADLTEFRTETSNRLTKISDDLDFLTHKEFQTEKEVFNLKKKIIG